MIRLGPAHRGAVLRDPPAMPFLLGVSWHNPHDICYWIMEMMRNRLDPLCHAGELPDLPPNVEPPSDEPGFYAMCRRRQECGQAIRWTLHWDGAMWRRYLRASYRLVEEADRELGRLLDAIDASGRADETVVVFTSDHGGGCAAHRWVVKLSLYDEAVRVPLLVRMPGRAAAGSVCRSHFASGIDLAPAISDLAGVPGLRG